MQLPLVMTQLVLHASPWVKKEVGASEGMTLEAETAFTAATAIKT